MKGHLTSDEFKIYEEKKLSIIRRYVYISLFYMVFMLLKNLFRGTKGKRNLWPTRSVVACIIVSEIISRTKSIKVTKLSLILM